MTKTWMRQSRFIGKHCLYIPSVTQSGLWHYTNLATGLYTSFQHRGYDQDLSEAIALHREALALHPVGRPVRSESLNNLANELSTHFHHRGNVQDLNGSIILHREALVFHPAIALYREVLALRPVGHPDRSMSFNNFANELFTRFEHQSKDQDLDESMALHREALALYPMDSTHFEHRGNSKDLDESLENLRCALTLLAQHHPRHLLVHHSLATVYLLFHRSALDGAGEDTDSINAAMHHLKAAANVVPGGLLSRLRASLRWVYHTDRHTHDTKLEAYATSMQLLDTYVSATASVSSQHRTMKVFPPTLAVELYHDSHLDPDGTIPRTPLDNLQECGNYAEALVKKFRDLSSLLDKHPAEPPEGSSRVTVEEEAARYARLVEDWNKAVEDIRKLEGFARFLLPPLFSALQDAARGGPIIVLIASKSSCNAIIVSYNQPLVSLALPTNLSERLERSSPASFAAIGQNHPPEHSFPWKAVKPELELVRRLLPPTVSFTTVASAESAKSRALDISRDNHWIHFACHGTQNLVEPFKCDQPLSLLKIAQTDLSRYEFAFLSACETAAGDVEAPDEVIHLAADLQFAGVKSVIGTFWRVDDSTV
ncbi:CHAT domain-containing protein [Suillus paluster]|uniref:CHAT domain-containing protein n=1 Tax=Suillus paluster TaxID=48578 RepID=UPI001B861D3E|nr:CHAT domain-containing protein [Suillus paluster]KAG1737567.1 CHAT domain-containing protein [Suillus paluster]